MIHTIAVAYDRELKMELITNTKPKFKVTKHLQFHSRAARTRSLLLERFWILERSVDIEGANFSAMTPSKQTMKREQLIGHIQGNAKFMDRRDISGLKAYEQ